MSNTELALYVITPILAAIVGAIIGAILAFKYQSNIELRRDKRVIIQALMMYRNVTANELDWIKAMNAIDIVFNKDKQVRATYHTLLSQLRPTLFENRQWIETYYQLIFEMALCTEYKNLSLHDIRDIYYPEALDRHYAYMNRPASPSNDSVNDSPPPTE